MDTDVLFLDGPDEVDVPWLLLFALVDTGAASGLGANEHPAKNHPVLKSRPNWRLGSMGALGPLALLAVKFWSTKPSKNALAPKAQN